MTSKSAALPDEIEARPDEVAARLRQRLLAIRSLWFPTPRELRAWAASGVPLYVRPLAADRLEVGPRLASMWAACFAPTLVVRTRPAAQGTVLHWRRRWPWFTRGLMVGWWVVLVAWPVALELDPSEDDPGRWLVFWAFLVVASTAGPAAGWVLGGRALQAALPWLRDALLQPEVDEDW